MMRTPSAHARAHASHMLTSTTHDARRLCAVCSRLTCAFDGRERASAVRAAPSKWRTCLSIR
eukprot:1993378-Rhodomonas_salina.2